LGVGAVSNCKFSISEIQRRGPGCFARRLGSHVCSPEDFIFNANKAAEGELYLTISAGQIGDVCLRRLA
jgi:hypothetical protein